MRDSKGGAAVASKLSKLSDLLCSDPRIQSASDEDDEDNSSPATKRISSSSAMASPGYWSDQVVDSMASIDGSPYNMSPWNPASSPFVKSPWIHSSAALSPPPDDPHAGLVGSLVREEGHVYSLAASGDLLYTGSDSKNIRVWKRWREFAGFKSGSGLVKAIVIAGGKIFTGHQDGKIRVWNVSANNPTVHKRIGTLPSLKDFLKTSINPSNYVEVRRHRNTVWIRHFDASCLSLDEEHGILYSGSWDKTVKVWRISDSKCLESVNAHDDAVNAVAAAPGGLLYTGSADGTVKLWRREVQGRGTRHVAVQTMLEQESAVTALAVGAGGAVVYCGSSDGLVNWWEHERRLVHRGSLRGHRMAVLCLASAGSLVMSGSADKTVSVWRRELGGVHTRLTVLAGHGGPIKCLAVEEDRETGGDDARWVVYSGSLDRSVRIWRVAERPLLPLASPMHVPSPLHVRSPMHVPGPTPAREAQRASYAEGGAHIVSGTTAAHVSGPRASVGFKDRN